MQLAHLYILYFENVSINLRNAVLLSTNLETHLQKSRTSSALPSHVIFYFVINEIILNYFMRSFTENPDTAFSPNRNQCFVFAFDKYKKP